MTRLKALLVAILRRWKWIALGLLIIGLLLGTKAWSDTMGDPVIQRASIALKGMPAGAPPVMVALLADIHVAGPDMPPSRLARIVSQVNALQPDIVLIAGDLVSEKMTATKIYSAAEIVAPLGKLSAPLGVWVAPGNHDHWFDWPGLSRELAASKVRVLQNEAAQVGPLVIGGVDDAYTRRDDLPATLAAMKGLEGGRLILTHSPDVFPHVPSEISLVLAGHTHCGQIRLPFIGAPSYLSRYGDRFACGVTQERGQTVITSGGIGTSLLPLRFGTRPEVWLVELTGE